MYSDVVRPSSWPWLAFQSSFGLVELAMAYTIAYSVMQPVEGAKNSKRFTSTSAQEGGAQITLTEVKPVWNAR